MRQPYNARQAGLSADALALFALLAAAPLTGRQDHETALAATGFNRLRYALALGQLEKYGCLAPLVVGLRQVMFTTCDGAQCPQCPARGRA